MVCLAVAMPQSITPYLEKSHEEWEELAMDYGFEYVDSEKKGKNEFGEATGVHRVREALEAGEWESMADLDMGGDEDGFEGSFAAEEAEMNMELFGMKGALAGFDDDEGQESGDKEVEELEVMMQKMVATLFVNVYIRPSISALYAETQQKREIHLSYRLPVLSINFFSQNEGFVDPNLIEPCP